ncbi:MULTISPECIES: hypothetical protein [Halorussus]|uniref:hypothetical protein n=1 Tax=Halorussus TaxID=1070314 RepID=UPI0020A07621|nr:hypothetical protein [Halorussus vallis]USZ76833.1 hypothetical protein NGM07_05765 [Halorussus vallis]
MDIDGYTYRKCGDCGERYYIHEDETRCESCRDGPAESVDGDSTDSASEGRRTDRKRDAKDESKGTSSAIEMIKRVNAGGD